MHRGRSLCHQVGSCLIILAINSFVNINYPFDFRGEREYVIDEDFNKAVRKVSDSKKLETKLDYKPV